MHQCNEDQCNDNAANSARNSVLFIILFFYGVLINIYPG